MATSLFDWIMDLMKNPDAREAFEANPQAAMASAGFSAVCAEDVADAKPFVLDHPTVRPIGDREVDHSKQADAEDQIRHIVNNYRVNVDSHDKYYASTPGNGNGDPAPDVDDNDQQQQQQQQQQQGGGDEELEVEENDIAQTDNEVGRDQIAVEEKIETDIETDDNIIGRGNAGDDLVRGDQVEFEGEIEDFAGEDNVDGLVAINDSLNLEDINALAVDLEDAELLNDSLNGVANGVLNGVGVGVLGTGTGGLPPLG